MRQIIRLLKVCFVTFIYTSYLAFTVVRKPPSQRTAYRAYRQYLGCRLLCRLLRVQVSLEGSLPATRGRLMVSNHFGVLDPIVLGSQIPTAFVSKAEVDEWPFVGWVTRTFGVIFVQRERTLQASQFVDSVQERIDAGVNVLVFPEGTTTNADRVLPFKTGAFAAVCDRAEYSILPLFLEIRQVNGEPANDVSRKQVTWANDDRSFGEIVWTLLGFESVHINIRIGTPVGVNGYDRKALARLLRERVCELGGVPVENGL